MSAADLILESLALGLRTTAGIDLQYLHRRHGIDLESANTELIDDLRARGLLETGDAARIVPTLRGLAVADSLAAAFEIPVSDRAS